MSQQFDKPEPRRWRFNGEAMVREWDAFLASDEGRNVMHGSAFGIYLENRLLVTFRAGMEAALKLYEQSEKK